MGSIIQAVLGGKSLGYEYTEDILTSTVFGTLKYIKHDNALIPFIEDAFQYDEKRRKLREQLNEDGIELRGYREVNYVFWSVNPSYGEPDLVIIFSKHIHGTEDLLLVIEAKFKSGKSGVDENDQLARYFDAIYKDVKNFSEPCISNFTGKKGYIIYLTEAEACNDISASSKIITQRNEGIQAHLFHLKWHHLYKTLESMSPYYSNNERLIAEDLMMYLEKLGLRDFSGITLPSQSLIIEFSNPYPVFYQENKLISVTTSFFSELPDVSRTHEPHIFYWGDING